MSEKAKEYLDIKVTTINGRHHARLLVTAEGCGYPLGVLDEMACEERLDIRYICHEMLRWHDKCGGTSPFASASRERMWKSPHVHVGRIWGQHQLQTSREKHLSRSTAV